MEAYYYNGSTVLKYLRKVLNEINKEYVDLGMRAGYIMKKFAEKYHFNDTVTAKLVLLSMLKDIGCFYQDGKIDKHNPALVAASSYSFLKHCSPLGDDAKPLLFYKAKYLADINSEEYYSGLLITLIDQVVIYIYEEYTLDEIEEMLRSDSEDRYNPEQIRMLIKLLKEDESIIDNLYQKNSLFIHEVSAYIQHANYTDEELLRFIDMTNFSFEFHNHETLAHTVTVAVIARELAKLSRLTENQAACIYLAGLIHDIGKIRVPVEILCKPGRLVGEELKEMQKHVTYTREIIEGSFSYKIVEIASNHHEKLDGSGYPRGLTAIDLSIGDKIIAVADIASALYCKRSYKESLPIDKIIDILLEQARANKLDARIVKHFVDNVDSIMALTKEAEAKVLDEYKSVIDEYNTLAKSEALKRFFE